MAKFTSYLFTTGLYKMGLTDAREGAALEHSRALRDRMSSILEKRAAPNVFTVPIGEVITTHGLTETAAQMRNRVKAVSHITTPHC